MIYNFIKRLFHTHTWEKLNTWSYKDQRCKSCGKLAYSSEINKQGYNK